MRLNMNLSALLFSATLAGVAVWQTGCHPASPSAHSPETPRVDRKFVRQCKGDVALPDDLLLAYNAFADAATAADPHRLSQSVLPHAVQIRPVMDRAITERPGDICLWHLGEHFAPDILVVRKDAENCYLIRTASSATWWVRTQDMGWKVCRYLRKPIE